MTVSFDVLGIPVPQGSKRGFVVGNRAVIVDDTKVTLREWRSAVAQAAHDESQRLSEHYTRPTPVRVNIEFRFPRPKTQTRAQRSVHWVAVRPDIDKCARAVLDAITAAGLVQDDAQVAQLIVDKTYAEEGGATGAYVIVSAL